MCLLRLRWAIVCTICWWSSLLWLRRGGSGRCSCTIRDWRNALLWNGVTSIVSLMISLDPFQPGSPRILKPKGGTGTPAQPHRTRTTERVR